MNFNIFFIHWFGPVMENIFVVSEFYFFLILIFFILICVIFTFTYRYNCMRTLSGPEETCDRVKASSCFRRSIIIRSYAIILTYYFLRLYHSLFITYLLTYLLINVLFPNEYKIFSVIKLMWFFYGVKS